MSEYLEFKLPTKDDYLVEYHDVLSDIYPDGSPLFTLLDQVRKTQASAIEEYLNLRIRPRPWFLPDFLWRFLVSKIIYVQYFKDQS
jgi:hypothetical protein|tara:strand:+ start:92 stop:349 length:258 start_codon:yes stop_codon:yes gene_type:complete